MNYHGLSTEWVHNLAGFRKIVLREQRAALGQRRGTFLGPLAAFCLLTFPPVVKADEWPIPRGPSHEPSPFVFHVDQLKSLPKEFLDDAAACIVYSGSTYLIEDDGTVETVTHEVIHFNGRKGIEKLGEYRKIAFDPDYEKPVLHEARVFKADGQIVPVELRHLQLRDVNTDYAVYNHDRQLVISFPTLETGDTIEVKWTVRGKNPEYQGKFFSRYQFGDDDFPVGRDEVFVRVPKSMPFKFGVTGGKLDPTVIDEATSRLYHWQTTNRRELPQEDDLPSREDLRLQLVFGTFGSWDEVAGWNRNLLRECWQATPEIKSVVQDVIKDCTDPAARARALTYWLRRNIRYVSLGVEHGYTPHPPAWVLGNRYGDCKDGCQLLAVMLREAGLNVALVSLCPQGDGQIQSDVPSPLATHALLQVTIDGKAHWIDTTISRAAWDYLPPADCDRVCYTMTADTDGADKTKIRVLRTPVARPEDNRIEQESRFTIRSDRSIICARTVTYHGTAALTQRELWLEAPAGERRRVVNAELQKVLQMRTRLTQLAIDEKKLSDFEQPVTAKLAFEAPGYFSGESELLGEFSDGKIWSKLVSLEWDSDRQLALDLGAPLEVRHRFVIEAPPAYRLANLPREKQIRSKWGAFTLHAPPVQGKNPRSVTLDFRLRLETDRVEPADFEAFRQFHDAVSEHYRAMVVLKPVDQLADAPDLEKVLADSPRDFSSALILAKLYMHNDKLNDARRVLAEALKHNPGHDDLAELLLLVGERAAKQIAAEQAKAHLQLAENAFKRDQPGDALEHLQLAGKADAELLKTAAAQRFQAQVREKLKQPYNALLAYQEVLRLEPNDADALAACVRIRLGTGDRAEALNALLRYTLAAGSDAEKLATAAELHYGMDRLDDAVALAARTLQHVTKAGSSDAAGAAAGRAERILGLVSHRREQFAEAVSHLEKSNLDESLRDKLVRAYLALGQLRNAEDAAGKGKCSVTDVVQSLVARRAAIAKNRPFAGNEVDALDHLICAENALAEDRPREQVEALLSVVFESGIDCGEALAMRGLLALERGRLTQAFTDAERAIALSPEEARGYYVRGRVRVERVSQGALADLAKAVELSRRKDAYMLHWLATAQYQAHQRDAAIATQREAVALRPTAAELTDQLRAFEKQVIRY